MTNSIVPRSNASAPMVLLLFMLMLLTIPLPAVATLYTYTSAPFSNSYGPPFPPSPGIGDSLTIQFEFGSVLSPLNSFLSPPGGFTMTSGGITLSSATSGFYSMLYIRSRDPSGLPLEWSIRIEDRQGLYNSTVPYAMYSYHYDRYPPVTDSVLYVPPGASWIPAVPVYTPLWMWEHEGMSYTVVTGRAGTWTAEGPVGLPVPLPAAVLLLGSGLLGLAGWRRLRKG
jgi:hypothetical protein